MQGKLFSMNFFVIALMAITLKGGQLQMTKPGGDDLVMAFTS